MRVCCLVLKTLALFQTGIPDQTDGIYTLFQTKLAKSIPYFRLEMLENDTLYDTYLYGLYMGVPLPPVAYVLISLKLTQKSKS